MAKKRLRKSALNLEQSVFISVSHYFCLKCYAVHFVSKMHHIKHNLGQKWI